MPTSNSVPTLRGEISVPGDKSITHRAIMFGGIAEGVSEITTSLLGRDNFATARIMRQLGAGVSGTVTPELHEIAKGEGFSEFGVSTDNMCHLRVHGVGLHGLKAPTEELDCGNSGTTARLLTGLLAGQKFTARLNGDHSLVKRPFKRVIEPLSEMGARFSNEKLPFEVSGGALQGIHFISEKASAQVKSAILLAGLYAEGGVSVTEPRLSRDHTERMFGAMGCELSSTQLANGAWRIELAADAAKRLQALSLQIPGDFSAAAFFLVAGSIFPKSAIIVSGVGFNPTRIGLFHVLERMGAKMNLRNRRLIGGEEVVDIEIQGTQLRGVQVTADDVVLGIDEIPILAMAAAVAEGKTEISGAEELRVKESDRLAMIINILRDFGVAVEEKSDGAIIHGNPALLSKSSPQPSRDAAWRKSGDHRIAMSGAILELLLCGRYFLEDAVAVETSFPNFYGCLAALSGISAAGR